MGASTSPEWTTQFVMALLILQTVYHSDAQSHNGIHNRAVIVQCAWRMQWDRVARPVDFVCRYLNLNNYMRTIALGGYAKALHTITINSLLWS